jgi:hypothetical protein
LIPRCYFSHDKSRDWAGVFLEYWCQRVMRSRLEPMYPVMEMTLYYS